MPLNILQKIQWDPVMQEKTKYQDKCRLKKGDEVTIMVGKASGESAKIEQVDYKARKVFVTGLNISKRHTKPGSGSEEGGIMDKVMPVDWSNVQLVDPKSKKPTRVGYKVENGKKVRFANFSDAQDARGRRELRVVKISALNDAWRYQKRQTNKKQIGNFVQFWNSGFCNF